MLLDTDSKKWYHDFPSYRKRFLHFPVDFFQTKTASVFYYHRLYGKIDDSTNDYPNLIIDILVFTKRSGIKSKQFLVDSVQSKEQVIALLSRKDFSKGGIDFEWSFRTKLFRDRLLNYCDLMNLTSLGSEMIYDETTFEFSDRFKLEVTKEQLANNSRFKYAKSTTMSKMVSICIKQFIDSLPKEIIYLTRKYIVFSVNGFNYFYANGNSHKQLMRQRASKDFPFLVELIVSRNNIKMIKNIDLGVSMVDYLSNQDWYKLFKFNLEYKTEVVFSKGALRSLHGVSAQMFNPVRPRFIRVIEMLSYISKIIKIKKINQNQVKCILEIGSALTWENHLGINLPHFFNAYTKEIVYAYNNKNDLCVINQLMEETGYHHYHDYAEFLKKYGVILVNNDNFSIRKFLKMSRYFHDNVVTIQQIEVSVTSEITHWTPLLSQNEITPEGYLLDNLTTKAKILEEGRKMSHCVGGYDFACLYRGSHIFSVSLDGQSVGTLEIRYDQNKKVLSLSQFNGFKNQKVDDLAADSIVKWFDKNKSRLIKSAKSAATKNRKIIEHVEQLKQENKKNGITVKEIAFQKINERFPNLFKL